MSLINPGVVRRAAVVALILGSSLALINQSAAIFGTAELKLLSLAQVFVTPFLVVVASQILGIRQAKLDARRSQPARETFLTTLRSHGIPYRALLTGLVFGSLNTAIAVTVEIFANGNISALALAPLGQSFSLPVLFGLLSQSLAYRRAVVTP